MAATLELVQLDIGGPAPLRRRRRMTSSPSLLVGAVLLLGIVAIAAAAPLVAPHDPLEIFPDALSGPSGDHVFGTDQVGHDVLSRVIFGARNSLIVGFGAAVLSAVVGGAAGLLAGYFNGILDAVVMRVWDALFALPVILLGIGLVGVLGPGWQTLILAIGLGAMPIFARIARATALQQRRREYIDAVRSLGASHGRVILRHLLPNAVGPLLVHFALTTSAAVLAEAALSFLGLGARPPAPSWGSMLADSRPFLEQAPWFAIAPGVAITILVISLNLVADGARDVFDVRGARRR